MRNPASSLLSYLRVLSVASRNDPRNDAELLVRFVESQDETAFATLICRHGPLVWRTCRRILGDTPDAEDAFQVAFLALARKASRVTIKSLAGWLHRVARQTALNADIVVRRRRNLEYHSQALTQSATEEEVDRAELYMVLDEELAILPEQLRVPLVLRYLEGKTLEEVARIIGCSRPVVRKRLVRGEAILRKRLERRGLAVGIASVGALLGNAVSAPAVPAHLIGSTARAAVAFRSGTLTGGVAEAARAVLEAIPASLETTLMQKSLWIVLACSLGLGGVALVACRPLGVQSGELTVAGPEVAQSAERPRPVEQAVVRVDCYGDPLPVGALARLGTVRLRHPEGISSVAFASDSKTVASGGGDGTVRLWEVTTGKEINTLRGHKGGVLSVAFSPDSKTVTSGGGRDKTVRLWDVADGKEIRTLHGHKDWVFSVTFSSDGKTVISGGADNMVRLWEAATGKEVHILQRHQGGQGHQGNIHSVVFSSDCKTVASAGDDSTVRLWEVATGKEIRTLKGHPGVMSVTFAPDGKSVASGGFDNTVRLWDVATGEEICILQGHGRPGRVYSVAFSSDGKILAWGGQDGTVLWDMPTGKEIRTMKGHQGPPIVSVAFTSDGKTVASVSGDGTVYLWEAATGKEIRRLQGGRWAVTFSPDGKIMATGGVDHTVRLWKVASGKEIRTLKGHQGLISSVAFASDGKILASVSADTTGLIWDVTYLARLEPMPVRPLRPPARSEKQLWEVTWTELGDTNPAKAYPALWKLTRSPTQAIALLGARLRPVVPADPQQLMRWVADLDDNNFTVRDKAQREITKLGELALPTLRQALKGRPSIEVRRRLQDLLAELEPKGVVVSPDRLRELRAVQVLESIGTAEAQQILQAWAKGVAEARLTVEAQAALDRLAKRSMARP